MVAQNRRTRTHGAGAPAARGDVTVGVRLKKAAGRVISTRYLPVANRLVEVLDPTVVILMYILSA
jgi:hypothetical protein